MITIKNSYDGNSTYVVSFYFINGCQVQPLDKLEEVCKLYKVPQHHIDELNNALKNPKYMWGYNEDWDFILEHDDYNILESAIKQGYGLDKFIDYDNVDIRVEVAKQKYGLSKLVNDVEWWIRYIVTKQGYGLDKLINDKSKIVRDEAMRKLNLIQIKNFLVK